MTEALKHYSERIDKSQKSEPMAENILPKKRVISVDKKKRRITVHPTIIKSPINRSQPDILQESIIQ